MIARMMPRPRSIPALAGSDSSKNRSIKFGVNEARNINSLVISLRSRDNFNLNKQSASLFVGRKDNGLFEIGQLAILSRREFVL